MYVYRDTGGQPDEPAAATPGPDEHDASYWYDLPGAGGGGENTPRVPQETRGPFEPLVSSADSPGTTSCFSASLDDASLDDASLGDASLDDASLDDASLDDASLGDASLGDAELAGPEAAHSDEAPGASPDPGQDEGQEDTAYAQARKLEQIKDLYLTAEAIGEANVDKHFDHLLAQQRELISEYFQQSNTTRLPGGPGDQAGTELGGAAGQARTEPGDPGNAGGSASVPEGARAIADQPRVW